MSANCEVIAIFPIYDQFGAIHQLKFKSSKNSGHQKSFKSGGT